MQERCEVCFEGPQLKEVTSPAAPFFIDFALLFELPDVLSEPVAFLAIGLGFANCLKARNRVINGLKLRLAKRRTF